MTNLETLDGLQQVVDFVADARHAGRSRSRPSAASHAGPSRGATMAQQNLPGRRRLLCLTVCDCLRSYYLTRLRAGARCARVCRRPRRATIPSVSVDTNWNHPWHLAPRARRSNGNAFGSKSTGGGNAVALPVFHRA